MSDIIFSLIKKELNRQRRGVELIASENFTSQAVINAMGSCLTNKYAEGYPGRRYYGGCEVVDEVEQLAIDRAKELFGAEWANVQPHSGAQANAAVFLACLQPGDKILGFNLAHGGHLSHGSPVNYSGKVYNPVFYGVEEDTGRIDMDKVEAVAQAEKPRLIICGASAYARDWDYARFRQIADSVGALLLADISHPAGLIAAKLLKDPMPHCHIVTSTTHKTLRGPRGGLILARKNEELEKKLNSAVFPGQQGGPLMHVIAAKAVCFQEALQPAFKTYQQQVLANAKAMASTVIARGYQVVSGGTENHLFLLSLIDKNITGKEADAALGQAHITVNKNAVPNDPRPPMVTSGIRIGTPACTTRGFGEAECRELANWICDIFDAMEKGHAEATIAAVRDKVSALCAKYPVYR